MLNDPLKFECIGICVKNIEGVVESQNQASQNICGQQVGKVCSGICSQKTHSGSDDQVLDRGFRLFKNIKIESRMFDLLVVRDGKNTVTIFLDREQIVQEQMQYLQAYHLTPSELGVLEKFLYGFSSVRAAAELFICKQTLRSHLNSIYKKIPLAIKNKILSNHFDRI